MKKTLLLFLLFMAGRSFQTRAQDTLYLAKGKIICTVLKISESEVEYKRWDNQTGPIYSVNRSEVIQVVYKNGITEHMNDAVRVIPGNQRPVSRHGFKVDLVAPAFHKFTLGYEYVLNHDIHFEGYASIISSRILPAEKGLYSKQPLTQGLGLRLGTKLMLSNEPVRSEGINGSWGGWYMRIDLLYTRASIKNIVYSPSYSFPYNQRKVGTVDVDQYGLTFGIGWQMKLDNRICVSFFGGLGYLLDNTVFKPSFDYNNENYMTYYENSSFRSGNALRFNNTAFCATGNLTLGYVLAGRKNQEK